jgi:hypothetical protein
MSLIVEGIAVTRVEVDESGDGIGMMKANIA